MYSCDRRSLMSRKDGFRFQQGSKGVRVPYSRRIEESLWRRNTVTRSVLRVGEEVRNFLKMSMSRVLTMSQTILKPPSTHRKMYCRYLKVLLVNRRTQSVKRPWFDREPSPRPEVGYDPRTVTEPELELNIWRELELRGRRRGKSEVGRQRRGRDLDFV